MHRKKVEVILRILAQESQDLELWLKRYGILKFRGYFVNFSEARDLFGIIFQFRGPNYKIRDYGMILEKLRGLSAKCWKLEFPGIVFLKENPWTKSTSSWNAPARSTVDRWPLPRSGAHRSSASGRSDARELRPRGGGGKRWAGEFNDGVATAREAVERHLTDGGASAWKGDNEGAFWAKRRSVGGVGVFTEGGAAFYRAEARRGRPSALNGWR
jgi:hypothetical protein